MTSTVFAVLACLLVGAILYGVGFIVTSKHIFSDQVAEGHPDIFSTVVCSALWPIYWAWVLRKKAHVYFAPPPLPELNKGCGCSHRLHE